MQGDKEEGGKRQDGGARKGVVAQGDRGGW